MFHIITVLLYVCANKCMVSLSMIIITDLIFMMWNVMMFIIFIFFKEISYSHPGGFIWSKIQQNSNIVKF